MGQVKALAVGSVNIQGNDGNGQQFPLWNMPFRKFEEGDFLDIPFPDTYNKKISKKAALSAAFCMTDS